VPWHSLIGGYPGFPEAVGVEAHWPVGLYTGKQKGS